MDKFPKLQAPLPTFSRLMGCIAAVRRLDLQKIDIDDLKVRLQDILHGYSLASPYLHEKQEIFRGVKYQRKPTRVSELHYPPAEKVRFFQRANRPHNPMFYGALKEEAVLFENRCSPGDLICVSRWRIKKKIRLNSAGYSKQSFELLGSGRRPSHLWPMPENGAMNTPRNRMVHKFLCEEFTRIVASDCDYQYKISAAITERLLSRVFVSDGQNPVLATEFQFDGLMYPSLAMRGNADNVALFPKSVDDSLKIDQASWLRIDRVVEDQEYEATILDYANSFDLGGNILWQVDRGLKPMTYKVSYQFLAGRNAWVRG